MMMTSSNDAAWRKPSVPEYNRRSDQLGKKMPAASRAFPATLPLPLLLLLIQLQPFQQPLLSL